MPLPAHIVNASDLETDGIKIVEGFLDQAQEKGRRAVSFEKSALQLSAKLKTKATPEDALKDVNLDDQLLTAAGMSDKSKGHIKGVERAKLVDEFLKGIHKNHGDLWREIVVYRFLLTKGDSLGGSMRNYTGARAGGIFVKACTDALTALKISSSAVTNGDGKIKALVYADRALVFDRKSSVVDKNIDIILLKGGTANTLTKRLASVDNYLACGELKGGIDPAGADEHWKTARHAIERIREKFGTKVKLFFVGAAIEASMAREAFEMLKADKLDFAANLTDAKQLAELATWLVKL